MHEFIMNRKKIYLLYQKQFRHLAQGCKNLWVFQHERNGKFRCRLIAGLNGEGKGSWVKWNVDSLFCKVWFYFLQNKFIKWLNKNAFAAPPWALFHSTYKKKTRRSVNKRHKSFYRSNDCSIAGAIILQPKIFPNL